MNFIPIFQIRKLRLRVGEKVLCSRSHSQQDVERGFRSRQADLRAHILSGKLRHWAHSRHSVAGSPWAALTEAPGRLHFHVGTIV